MARSWNGFLAASFSLGIWLVVPQPAEAVCAGGAPNGILESPVEECDQGGETLICDADCTFAFCGDGVHNTLFESCDPSVGVAPNDPANCNSDVDNGSTILTSPSLK